MSAKLAAAKTVRVTANRTASSGSIAGIDVAEKAHVTAVVVRPNKLAAIADTNLGKRSIFYDGANVTLVDHKPGTHAQIKAARDIDSTVRALEETYDVMPPLAELMANDPRGILLDGVTKGEHKGTETVDGTLCDHLSFQQPGIAWELWVGTGDMLPKKMTVNRTDAKGEARTVSVVISKWELDTVIPASEFTANVPKDSIAVEMIPQSSH